MTIKQKAAKAALIAIAVLVVGTKVYGSSIVAHQQGDVALSSPGGYDWWYGCSPTSAGMMMGYYDLNGYDNLVPGGQAESHTFGDGPYLVNDIIASADHITDFYGGLPPGGGYGVSGDDLDEPWHDFNCLADFMGTSQDAYSNSNGSTTFWNYTGGERLYDYELVALGSDYYEDSGMYGIREYVEYAGYETGSLFNQYISGYNGNTDGFTFDNYVAEIDAGRPVLIHVDGHTMYGYGYDSNTDEVILHDTWTQDEERMAWGGSYSGMEHYAITAVEIIPEPGVIIMALFCCAGLGAWRRIFSV
ncbi:MAG: C39 family peptidase [Kiritimatiellales bacterium]|nr:C39 family peptidase [Kiritimatiellales bacterium]